MPIRDWPMAERPREKLLARGPESLSDAELLAILLRSGIRGQTALDLARQLLVDFGGLRAFLEANQVQFCRARGLGTAKFAELRACLEIGTRYLESRLVRGQALCSPQDTRNYLIAKLQGYKHEVFACLFLDSRHRLVSFEEMFRGTIDGTSVHPREVVSRALALNAAAAYLPTIIPRGFHNRAKPTRYSPVGCAMPLRSWTHECWITS